MYPLKTPARRGAVHRAHHNINADFVRLPAYGVCHEAEKPKAYRSFNPTASR
jgi:hypothetical protein